VPLNRLIPLAALAGLALITAGAVPAGPSDHRRGGTLVFATEGDPTFLDGAIVSDGTSLRVIDQMFETLVDLRPGTTRIVPGLATRWTSARRGRVWTFTLRRGVRFHDGTRLNARAVCFNFNRWYNFRAAFQSEDATYYWQQVFGGFRSTVGRRSSPEILRRSLFRSCRAVGAYRVRLTLTRPSASFLGGLALKNFAIASPAALRRYGANRGRLDSSGQFRYTGTFATRHPIGTGPFRFRSWTLGERVVLERFNRYWGPNAHVQRLIFRPIADNAARLQALQTGEVQGYDLVAPQDLPTIRRNRRLKTLDRPAFNVAYVGFNIRKAPMNRLNVRRAIAHGLDRRSVVRALYGPRGQVAHQFQPPSLFGYARDVVKYNYNPTRSRQLLRAAGLRLPVRLDFFYFTRDRPYLPNPRGVFEGLSASLERAGFDIEPHVLPFRPDYLSAVDRGEAGHLRILGWSGDFGDPDNFLGTFFQSPTSAWGFRNPRIHRLLDRAETEPNFERRVGLYREANRVIMRYLPGVPFAHFRSALGFQRRVQGFRPSPVTLEPFSLTFYSGGR
jgi:peptide/nickel transport system substrate-binding protein